jgi:hypothetical protein
MRLARLVLVAVLILVLAAAATPTLAAPGATILSITQSDCHIDVVYQVQDAGPYFLNAWDDGNFRAGAGGNVGAGETVTARLTLGGPILQGAAGIGLYVEDGLGVAATTTYAANGSFNFPNSDSIGTACAAAGSTWSVVIVPTAEACLSSIPSGAVQGRMLETAQAVFEPRSDATTNVIIPGGTAWWIVDAEDGYYELVISCSSNYVWVPASSMGPNYDSPWNGAPLPDANVP